ncbi:unnamed protein product, partial [Prorocentrum cordatum]
MATPAVRPELLARAAARVAEDREISLLPPPALHGPERLHTLQLDGDASESAPPASPRQP